MGHSKTGSFVLIFLLNFIFVRCQQSSILAQLGRERDSYPQQQQESGPDPDIQYGPPGFTPGEPLGLGYYDSTYTTVNTAGPTVSSSFFPTTTTSVTNDGTTTTLTQGYVGGYDNYRSGERSLSLPEEGQPQITEKPYCNNTNLEANKRLAMNFYQTALRDKRADLMNLFLAEDYLNHSPYSNERGLADFQRIMTEGGLAPEPSQNVDFRRVDAIEDRVWVHSTWKLNGKQYSVMDLWTVNCDGLLQEHWDVLQDINLPRKNPVAFF